MGGGDSSEKGQSLNPEEKAKAEVEAYLRVPFEVILYIGGRLRRETLPFLANLAKKY